MGTETAEKYMVAPLNPALHIAQVPTAASGLQNSAGAWLANENIAEKTLSTNGSFIMVKCHTAAS